jgi:hypothetical protein
MPLSEQDGSKRKFRGSMWVPSCARYQFGTAVLGRTLKIGHYKPDAAESGARLYDSLQLLLHGPHAETNFKWSGYSQADVAGAARLLLDRGVDVQQAVLSAGGSGSCWTGVSGQERTWAGKVMFRNEDCPGKKLRMTWSGLPSAEAAARRVDPAFLCIYGLDRMTNFPASTYAQLELEEAGARAVSRGVEEGRVTQNLAAVEKVRGCPCVPHPAEAFANSVQVNLVETCSAHSWLPTMFCVCIALFMLCRGVDRAYYTTAAVNARCLYVHMLKAGVLFIYVAHMFGKHANHYCKLHSLNGMSPCFCLGHMSWQSTVPWTAECSDGPHALFRYITGASTWSTQWLLSTAAMYACSNFSRLQHLLQATPPCALHRSRGSP